MSAHRNPGTVDVGIWLRVAGVDYFLHVNADFVCVDGELVGKPDINITIGGLCQFRHLCRLGVAHIPNSIFARQVGALIKLQYAFIELDCRLGARLS